MSDDPGTVRVIGTAHVSAESVREVEGAIETERPDVVAVELDEGRYRQLKGETPDDLEPSDLLRGNTVFQFIAYWMLSYVQTRLGERFDVEPGAEMMAAVETAEEFGIDVALVDRDIQETIQRFWARMTFLEKLRMVGGLAFGVSDPRVAGIVFGLLAGLVAGPLVGLFGESVGLTGAVFVSITGGVALGAVLGYLSFRLGSAVVGGDAALLAGAGGAVVGLTVGLGGAVDPLVSTYLSEFAVGAVGSLAVGLAIGLVVGVLAAAVIDVSGLGVPEEDFEEFDPEELTDADVVTAMMEEFREFSPGGAEALIDERDAYIAHRLIALRAAGKDVLAVVGAGHREGIEGYLRNPETLPPLSELTGTERGGRGVPWGKLLGGAVSVAFVGFFVLLAMAGVRDTFLLRVFAAWFLINAVCAAGLAKLAGARWRSAGVGGAVAWMTSINPLLAPGWFTGYVELRHTRVNVADISRLNDLLSDETRPIREVVADMFDVPLFRLIMIVAATNVGSVIASLLFVTYVLPAFGAELGGVDGVTRLMVRGASRSADLLWRAVT